MSIFTNVTITIDPLGHYVSIPRDRIRDSLGYTPQIVECGVRQAKDEKDAGFWIWTIYQYGNPLNPPETKLKFKDGILTYPKEEPEYPIAVYHLNNVAGLDIRFWQYEHAMTVYTVNGKAILFGRMD